MTANTAALREDLHGQMRELGTGPAERRHGLPLPTAKVRIEP